MVKVTDRALTWWQMSVRFVATVTVLCGCVGVLSLLSDTGDSLRILGGASFCRLIDVGGCAAFYVLVTLIVYGASTCGRLGRRQWVPPVMIFVIVLFANVAVVRIMDVAYGQKMFSDFALAQSCLESGQLCHQHPAFILYWSFYELFLSFLGVVLTPSLFVGQLVNSCCIAAATYPIYRFTERVAGRFWGILLALLMGLSPQIVLYGTVLTGEYIAATSLLYALMFWEMAFSKDMRIRKLLLISVATGLCLAIAHLFKPVEVLLIFSVVILAFVSFLVREMRFRFIGRIAFSALASLGIVALCSNAARFAVKSVGAEQTVEKKEMSIWRGAVIGMNIASGGVWEEKVSSLAQSMDDTAARQFVIRRFKDEWRQYPLLFKRKFKMMYDSGFSLFWSGVSELPRGSTLAQTLLFAWFYVALLLVLSGLLGSLVLIWRKGFVRFQFIALSVVAGFTTLLMFIEVQDRYRMAIYPFYYLLMSCALTGGRELWVVCKTAFKK